jgi:hypothetical protein
MPRKRTHDFGIAAYPLERAERLAKIMGESSAAAAALKELKSRLASGEDVALFVCGAWIFVGPRTQQSNGQTAGE